MSEDSESTNKKTLTQRLAEIGGVTGTVAGTALVSLFLYYRSDLSNYTPPHLLVDIFCTVYSLEICGLVGYVCGESLGFVIDDYRRQNPNE